MINYTEGKQLTHEEKIEGIGTVQVFGSLDFQKLVERLLKSNSITSGTLKQ